jgi:hypothetical protein
MADYRNRNNWRRFKKTAEKPLTENEKVDDTLIEKIADEITATLKESDLSYIVTLMADAPYWGKMFNSLEAKKIIRVNLPQDKKRMRKAIEMEFLKSLKDKIAINAKKYTEKEQEKKDLKFSVDASRKEFIENLKEGKPLIQEELFGETTDEDLEKKRQSSTTDPFTGFKPR